MNLNAPYSIPCCGLKIVLFRFNQIRFMSRYRNAMIGRSTMKRCVRQFRDGVPHVQAKATTSSSNLLWTSEQLGWG